MCVLRKKHAHYVTHLYIYAHTHMQYYNAHALKHQTHTHMRKSTYQEIEYILNADSFSGSAPDDFIEGAADGEDIVLHQIEALGW